MACSSFLVKLTRTRTSHFIFKPYGPTGPILGLLRLVKKFKEDNERVRYFKPDEEESLEEVIDFAPSHLKSFILLTRHTGMRSGEALNLKIKQVDLQERIILLTKTKRGK